LTVEEVPVPYSTVPVPVQYCVLKDYYAPDCLDAPAQDEEGGVDITRLLLPGGEGEEGRNLDALHHRQNNYKIKTPNPKYRLLMLNRVYRLEIQSVMLVFSTPLVN
jgi:hypothetical protein